MLKLKDGYTVFSQEPQYGDRDEVSDVDDGGYVRAGARLRKWKMEKGGQDA